MRRQSPSGAGRAEIAALAARLLATGGARDFDDARRRAQDELGLVRYRDLPDNRELQRALADYLVLFQGAALTARLERLRVAALHAFELFAPFAPRLCGPVWYGTACAHTPISLHLTSDETEAVTRFLLDRRIPYHLADAAFRFPGLTAPHRMPRFEITVDGDDFELVVFPSRGALRHPLSAIDDRLVKRVGRAELEALIAAGRLLADERDAGV